MSIVNLPIIHPKVRWLLSETLVVVLGVLIALALNDYWTYRQERALELQYLERIRDDVNIDISLMDDFGKRLLERKLNALDSIAPVIRGEQTIPEDLESFFRNVSLGAIGGASPTHWTTSTTFQEMRSTGNLRLIRNSGLRSRISLYYEEFDEFYTRTRDRRTGYTKLIWSVLPGELRERMDLAAIEEFGIERALNRIISPEFQDLMHQEYNYAFFNLNVDSSSAKQLVEELENHITLLEGES